VDCKAAGALLQPSRSSVGSSEATVSITGNLERILRNRQLIANVLSEVEDRVVMEEIKSEVKQRVQELRQLLQRASLAYYVPR